MRAASWGPRLVLPTTAVRYPTAEPAQSETPTVDGPTAAPALDEY